MGILREWVITILAVIIFVTFVEILIPNSNHKRYINVVVGFLIMIVILNPLISVLNEGMSLGDGILRTTNQMEQLTFKNTIDRVGYEHNDVIIDLYRNNLIKQMRQRIEEGGKYVVYEIEIDIEDKERDRFGLIKHIHLVLKDQEKATKVQNGITQEIDPVKVDKILVDIKNHNIDETQNIMLSSEEGYIKNDLSNFYNVPKENISIYILKNN